MAHVKFDGSYKSFTDAYAGAVENSQPQYKFNIGDIVYLKSGSPAMTVVQRDRFEVMVRWVDGTIVQEMRALAECFTLDGKK